LCSTAIWHRSHCTWIGREPLVDRASGSISEIVYRPLGADLYGGTAGVSWFLAELSVASGDEDHRRSAVGAIRHALARAEAGGMSAIGLFDGALGVALVAERLGSILDSPRLRRRGRALAVSIVRNRHGNLEADLLGGAAGAILGLLALNALRAEPVLERRAASMGDWLLRSAQSSRRGASWPWSGERCYRNPTGYSHGAAGIAHGLLELYALTSESRYRECAEHAFRYERASFDETARNWLDYRLPPGPGGTRGWTPTCASAWCHGAPGIALSRLRAYEVLGDPAYRAEAAAALETTRASLVSSLASSTPDFCLCHGLAGNAQIVDQGARVLGGVATDEALLTTRVAHHGAIRYGPQAAPEHHAHDEPPGLMHGLAGIGHFYLCRARPATPSPLLLGRGMLQPPPAASVDGDSATRNEPVALESA
jgi:lantibiotic modifying enzyme